MIENPRIENPLIENSLIENSTIENPLIENPSTENPAIESPLIENSTTEKPLIENPSTETPAIESPLIENSTIENPLIEDLSTETLIIENPSIEILTEHCGVGSCKNEVFSSKRRSLFASMFADEDNVITLQALCPTRWCARESAIEKIVSAYPQLLATLNEIKCDKSCIGETKAKAANVFNVICSYLKQ